MLQYEPVIGLEVHVHLNTTSKIFCSCSTQFGLSPNQNTCPVCLGLPGVLPVFNRQVLINAIKMAFATRCVINERSIFARKHYFYPDLPKGFQISQYELPLAEHGEIIIETDGNSKKIGITRIHLEEDAGKLVHDENRPISYVDLNRACVPLIEIVSEPDIRTPEEAAVYLKKIRTLVRYLGISDGNMEEGSLRCDANISLRPVGQEKFGTKTELKNMNSFRNVQKALEYEIKRQTTVLLEGKQVIQETRLWDVAKNITLSMRGKEEAHDYRYFPEPDLPPVIVSSKLKEEIKNSLPELPDDKFNRFVSDYELPPYDAGVLTSSISIADYYESCLKTFNNPKTVSNWIMVELLRLIPSEDLSVETCPVKPQGLCGLLQMIDDGKISGKMGKDILEKAFNTKKDPKELVEEQGLSQVSDENIILDAIKKVLSKNPGEVEKYKSGKTKVFGFFVGQVMKDTKGKANPGLLNDLLKKALEE